MTPGKVSDPPVINDLRPVRRVGKPDEFGRVFFGQPWLTVNKFDVDCWRVEVCWWYRKNDEKDFTWDAADDLVWVDRGSALQHLSLYYGVDAT